MAEAYLCLGEGHRYIITDEFMAQHPEITKRDLEQNLVQIFGDEGR